MPLYEYECDACGRRFERIQKFSDPLATECPTCGGLVRKLFSSPAIQFKGSGFYITDYAKAGSKGSESADGSSGKDAKESTDSKDSKETKGAKETTDSSTKAESSSTSATKSETAKPEPTKASTGSKE